MRCGMGVACKDVLSNTHFRHHHSCSSSHLSPKHAYFEGISLESVPCRCSSLAPGCCSSMLLHVIYVSKMFVEIISQTATNLQNSRNWKTRENLALYVGLEFEQQAEWSYHNTYQPSGRWLSYRWSFEYVVGWTVCRTLPFYSSNLSCLHEERYRPSPALAYYKRQEVWWESRNKDRLVHTLKS